MKTMLCKSVLIFGSALFFASTTFAAETAVQTEAVQNQLKSTNLEQKEANFQKGKDAYENSSHQEQIKAAEKQHRINVHNYRKEQFQEKNQTSQ